MVSISQSKGEGKNLLVLAPPLGDKPLNVLEVKLRLAAEEGRFGTAEVAQDVLEFAALASQPGCLNKAKQVPGLLNKYAGYMLDAVTAYGNSATLDVWLAEALVCIHNLVIDSRDQLALPIFDAVVKIIVRSGSELSPELNDRLIGALVAVSSPNCRFTDSLIEFVIDEMNSRQGRMSPLTLEHCLALLGIARSKRWIEEQVRLVLAAPRGFMSEVALATRALITLADVYSLVADLATQSAKIQAEQAGTSAATAWRVIAGTVADDVSDLDTKVVHDCGVPVDGSDVRLVMTLLDLHRRNRKTAGAAFRVLATMCRLTKDHMAAILVDESRGLILAQEAHMNSRAVNLHATEVILVAAARPGPNLISGAMMLMVGRALRSFPQDAQIVSSGLHALQLIADDDEQAISLLEIIPSVELIRIGEVHCADPSAMRALCDLLTCLSEADPQIKEDLVQNGAVAIPFRSMEAALESGSAEGASPEESSAEACAAAARLVLSLTYLADDAFFHAAKVDGGGILLAVLDLHLGHPSVTHAGLMALKNIAHEQTVRRLVVLPEDQTTWSVLDKVLYVADMAIDKDPDILPQACCAISTLTTVEGDERGEDMMRNSINQEYLARIIEKMRWHWPRFSGDINYCLRLMVMAATEPHKTRLLDNRGNEVYGIGKGRNDQVAAWDDVESDEYEEPLQLQEPDVVEEPADRIRGADLQRQRKRIQEKVETAEISIQTDQSTTASGDEHVSVDSRDSHEKEVDTLLDGIYGTPRDSQESDGIFGGLFGSDAKDDTRRDSTQRLMAAFGLEDSEDETSPGKNRAMRRRMHEKNHGFKEGKGVPKLTKAKSSESGWLGGLLTSTPEEQDETEKKEDGADSKEEEPEEEDWFGLGKLFGSEGEEDDAKAEEKEPSKETSAKQSTSWFSRSGDKEAKDKDTKKEGENEEDEEEEASGWGDLFATDDEVEAKAAAKAERKAEKERKAKEEAEKKKGVFGGLFG